jgi:hypothetical protein
MTEKLTEVRIKILTHSTSGLKMATSEDLPGFVVHANSAEELDEKIPAALKSFCTLTRDDKTDWVLISDDVPPGFEHIAYTARQAAEAA